MFTAFFTPFTSHSVAHGHLNLIHTKWVHAQSLEQHTSATFVYFQIASLSYSQVVLVMKLSSKNSSSIHHFIATTESQVIHQHTTLFPFFLFIYLFCFLLLNIGWISKYVNIAWYIAIQVHWHSNNTNNETTHMFVGNYVIISKTNLFVVVDIISNTNTNVHSLIKILLLTITSKTSALQY